MRASDQPPDQRGIPSLLRRGKRARSRRQDPRELYDGLRDQILDLDPASAGLATTPQLPRVWGALLETGYDKDVATLVSLSDGTTSLYTTSGFVLIGGGGHAQVVSATQQFLVAIEESLDGFQPDQDSGLPADEETIIRALTFDGRLAVRAPEADFGYGRHQLSKVFHAGEAVITELRLLHESRPD